MFCTTNTSFCYVFLLKIHNERAFLILSIILPFVFYGIWRIWRELRQNFEWPKKVERLIIIALGLFAFGYILGLMGAFGIWIIRLINSAFGLGWEWCEW